MADGRVTYEFEADYSNLEKDVKQAEKIVSDSSDEAAKKQKENDKEVAENAKKTTDEKVKVITEGNKKIVTDSENISKSVVKHNNDIIENFSGLNKEYQLNEVYIKSVNSAIKEFEKEQSLLNETLKKTDKASPDYTKYEAQLTNVNKKIEEAKYALTEYNKEQASLQKQITDTEKAFFNQTKSIESTSEELKNMSDNVNQAATAKRGLKADLTGLINSLKTGNVSASTFTRTLTGMGSAFGIVSIAIGALIKVYQLYNKEQEEARKRLEQVSAASRQAAETTKAEYDEVSKLTSEYEKLGNVVNPTADEKDRLAEIQDLLNSKYLTEAERLDLLNGKYSENLSILKGMSAERSKQAEDAANRQFNYADAFYNNPENIKLNPHKLTISGYDISIKAQNDLKNLTNEFENINNIKFGASAGQLKISGNAAEQVEALKQMQDILFKHGDHGSKLFQDIKNALESAEKAVEEYIDAERDLADINRTINGETYEQIKSTEAASDAFANYAGKAGDVREQLVYLNDETRKNNDALISAQEVVQDYEKELISLENRMKDNSGSDELIKQYNDVNAKLETSKTRVESLKTEKRALESQLRYTTAEYKAFITETLLSGDALKGLEKETKLLSSAFAEMNEHKSISIDTMLSLIDAGYAAIIAIDEETGAVRINAEAYRELAGAKLQAQQADYASQIAALNAERSQISSRIGYHNYKESSTRIQEIDKQIQNLQLQNAAVGQISNSLDYVVAGTYKSSAATGASAAAANYQKELERIEKERKAAEEKAEKERKAAEAKAEKERLTAEKQAEKDRKAAEKQAKKESNAAIKLSNSGSSGNSGGNVISITSYIPTIWDDVKTSNAKLKAGLGASIVGNSKTGKLVSGLETVANNAGNITVPSARTSTITSNETTLKDVVKAINSLKASPKPVQPINLKSVLDGKVISQTVIKNINEITEKNGKSPLIK